jgi:hypothetical protein
VLDPERLAMELVEGLLACVEVNAMRRYRDEPDKPSIDSEELVGKESKKRRILCSSERIQRRTRMVTKESEYGG